MTNIKIPTFEGKNIAAFIHHPSRRTNRLAILCPGYLDTKDYDHLVKLTEELAKIGYTVVRFDPIGTWESDGDISDYTTTQYLRDIRSVLEFTLLQGDYKHILIGGHSRGGMVSILYAAQDPKISIVVGIMSSSVMRKRDDRLLEAERLGFSISFRDLPENKNQKREFRVPYSHFQDRLKYNVLKNVKNVKVPIIFIAGELDKLVPPKNVKEIYKKANEPKKFILIPGIGHDYRHNPSEIRLVNNEILKQLKSLDLSPKFAS